MASKPITHGKAYADPSHPIHAKLKRARQAMRAGDLRRAKLQAQGMSAEQAWTQYLREIQP